MHVLNIKMDSKNLPINNELWILPDFQGENNLVAYSQQNLVQSVFYWSPFGIIVFVLYNFIVS